MLFPLSKDFCSTRVFQTGTHSEPPRKPAYTHSNPELENKTRDLHRLLHEKKSYQEHLDLARSYSETQRLADQDRAKSYLKGIKDVQAENDARGAKDRAEVARRIREHRESRESRDDDLRGSMRATSLEYTDWRTSMQGRVKNLGKIWGGAPVQEGEERQQMREENRRNMRLGSRRYMQEQEALRRSLSASIVKTYRGTSMEEAAEERKRTATTAMSQTARDWESHLESLYKKHDDRIRQVQRGHVTRHLERVESLESGRLAVTTRLDATAKKAKAETQARDQRIATRSKGFAGYQPLEKSEKRLRVEKALQDPGAPAPMMTGTSLPPRDIQERTLSPRTLGAGGGAQ